MSQPTITPKVADSNKKSNTSKSVSKVKTPKPPKPPKVKEVQPNLPLIPISKLPPPIHQFEDIQFIKVEEIDTTPNGFYSVSLGPNTPFSAYMSKVGFRVPMVVTPSPTGSDFKYKVIDGVSRLAIAKSLGCESVPCIIVEDTSEEALLRIGLNTTRVKSKFEYFLELDELKKLLDYGQGFRADKESKIENLLILKELTKLVGSTGTIDAFKRIVRGLDEIREKGDDQDKQIAERIYTQLRDGECSTSAAARMVEEVRSKFGPKPTKSPKSVPTIKDAVMNSPTYQLITGECVGVAMGGELPQKSIQCVFTTPPIFGHCMLRHDGESLPVNTTITDLTKYLVECFDALLPVLKDDHTIWVNMNDYLVDGSYAGATHQFVCEMLQGGYRLVDEIIWSRPNPKSKKQGTSHQTVRSHEYAFVFTKAKGRPFYQPIKLMDVDMDESKEFPLSVGMGSRQNGSVLNLVNAVLTNIDPQDNPKGWINHPSMMAWSLPWLALRTSTQPNSVILDPFCGQSGVVGLATLSLGEGRKFIGVDISEEHVKNTAVVLGDFLFKGNTELSPDPSLALEEAEIAA